MPILYNKSSEKPPYKYDVDAKDVSGLDFFQGIKQKTDSGTWRCAGASLDACKNTYDWRSAILSGYKANNKRAPAGFSNSWTMKKAIKESGAGTLFYDRARDGNLSAEDMGILKKFIPSASVYGWGDANEAGYINDTGPKKSQHTTTTVGKDVKGDMTMYSLASTDAQDDRWYEIPANTNYNPEDMVVRDKILQNDSFGKYRMATEAPNYVAIPASTNKTIQYYRKPKKVSLSNLHTANYYRDREEDMKKSSGFGQIGKYANPRGF